MLYPQTHLITLYFLGVVCPCQLPHCSIRHVLGESDAYAS